jgi:hypothetical protein
VENYKCDKVVEDGIEYEIREYLNGDRIYFLNGKYHRVNGPAEERLNGDKLWYRMDRLHREDGPAAAFIKSGRKEYWLNNKFYSNIENDEEWIRLVPIIEII